MVTLKGERRRTINPVFGLVARWFFMGETHPVQETLNLVKEGGSWKVCGKPFRLIESESIAVILVLSSAGFMEMESALFFPHPNPGQPETNSKSDQNPHSMVDAASLYARLRDRARQIASRYPPADFYRDHAAAVEASRTLFESDALVVDLRQTVCARLEDDFGHGMLHAAKVALDRAFFFRGRTGKYAAQGRG